MIEEILQHATPKLVVVAVVAIFALVKVTQWVTTELKIRSLGGHAHRVKTWLPGGMSSRLFLSTHMLISTRLRPHRSRHQRHSTPQEPRSLE